MLRKIFALSFAVGVVGFSLLPADAQTFQSSRTVRSTHSSAFDSNFERFSQDLSETGEKMKVNRAMVESMTAKRLAAQSAANQADTAESLQRAFMNGQIQALNSGGTYNTPVRTVTPVVPGTFLLDPYQ